MERSLVSVPKKTDYVFVCMYVRVYVSVCMCVFFFICACSPKACMWFRDQPVTDGCFIFLISCCPCGLPTAKRHGKIHVCLFACTHSLTSLECLWYVYTDDLSPLDFKLPPKPHTHTHTSTQTHIHSYTRLQIFWGQRGIRKWSMRSEVMALCVLERQRMRKRQLLALGTRQRLTGTSRFSKSKPLMSLLLLYVYY